MNKVSCIMPTYRRFSCVERSIAFFLNQKTELEKELIILNTDIDNPLELDDTFTEKDKTQIIIINNNNDYITDQPYNNTGAIRRDAFSHASGELYITWDDDDIFLPWNIQQCYDGLCRSGKSAWKPHKSFMWNDRNSIPKLEYNYFEATAIVKSNQVSFNLNTGPENLSWFEKLMYNNDFTNAQHEEDLAIPGYCFNWADPYEMGVWHKQSGYINEKNCFEDHKKSTTDVAKRKLKKNQLSNYSMQLSMCNLALQKLPNKYQSLIEKYIGSYDYIDKGSIV